MECETYAPPLGYDIGEAGVAELQRGFLSAMPRICFLTATILSSLRQYLLSEVGPFITDSNDWGFGRINVGSPSVEHSPRVVWWLPHAASSHRDRAFTVWLLARTAPG